MSTVRLSADERRASLLDAACRLVRRSFAHDEAVIMPARRT